MQERGAGTEGETSTELVNGFIDMGCLQKGSAVIFAKGCRIRSVGEGACVEGQRALSVAGLHSCKRIVDQR